MSHVTWDEPKEDRGWASCDVGGEQGHNKTVGWYIQYGDAYGQPKGSFLASAYVLEVNPITGTQSTRNLGQSWKRSKESAKKFIESLVVA